MFDETNAPAANAPNSPAPDLKAPESTSNASQPPPPAPAPTPVVQPAKPAPVQPDSKPGNFFHRISHSFAGALIGALAGQDPVTYKTDESGNMTAVKVPQTNRSRLQRVAQAAMEGLAAGAAAPRRQGAEVLSGLGAGFAAQQAKAQQQDVLARQQAKESFDEQQKAMVQKYQNAHWNAQTAVEIANAKKLGEEAMQSHYHDTQDLTAGAREGDLDVSEHSVAEAEAILAADKAAGSSSFVKHVVLGMLPPVPQIENGKPVLDAQGQPIMEKRLAIITEDKKGNVILSPSMVQRIQRVGKMAQISNAGAFQPGQPVPLDQFKNLFARVKSAENIVATKPPEVVQVDDGTGKKRWMKSNALGEKSDLTAEESLAWQQKQAAVAHTAAQTRKEDADAALATVKAKSEAANAGGGSNLIGEDYLKTLPVGRQATVRAIGEGRQVLSSGMLRTKDGQALAKDVNQAYPTYDASKSESYFKLRKEFDSGKVSAGINSFNTVLTHLSRMFDHVSPMGTLPIVSGVARAFGNKSAAALNVDRQAVSTELAKAYANGQISEGEVKDWERRLDVASATELKNNLIEVANLLNGKLDAYQAQWDEGVPSSFIPPRPIISTVAKAAFEHITGGENPQASQNPQAPSEQTQGHKIGDIVVQNGQNFRVTAVDPTGKVTAAEAQ
jgi:hypothetical protein